MNGEPLVGSTLGHYRIESSIGEGGMGVVYLAFDTKLERRVAVKVLRLEALGDPDRRRRFVLEARAASALNHPNIVTIHDIAEERSLAYIVMEYVEGRTLTACIGKAPLPAKRVLHLALQVSDALARAHAAGIVHRDIKPDNIIVSDDDRLKVLDFGLAKLVHSEELLPTPVTFDPEGEGTLLGSVLGTAAYMSPEQAAGRPADARSDIFSFGAVLYEMATGRRAFPAANNADAMLAVLTRDPIPPSKANSAVSQVLENVILKCLEKKPNDRPQRMDEVRQELLRQFDTQGGTPYRKLGAAVAAVLVLLLAAAGGNRLLDAWNRAHRPRINIIPVTTYPGQEMEPAISPDGTRVAFVWDGDDGRNLDLYVKPVEGGEPFRLTKSPELKAIPIWSPDGSQIAFLRRQEGGLFDVMVVSATGGPARKICVAARGLDWSPDGTSLVIMEPEPNKPRGLLLVNLATGEKRRLTSAPEGVLADRSARFSPDGESVAFSRTTLDNVATIYTIPVKGGEMRKVVQEKRGTAGLDWTADGKEIVYSWASIAAQPSLYRVPVSGGVPEPVLPEAYYPAVARRSNRLAFQQTIQTHNIWRAARIPPNGPKTTRANLSGTPLISSSQTNSDMRYSPDGKKIAFASQRTGIAEIWVADSDGHHEVQITSHFAKSCGSPSFSPDGAGLVFDCSEGAETDIFTSSLRGGPPQRLTSDHSSFVPGWSRDGRWIYYTHNSSAHGGLQIWRMPSGGGPAEQLTKNGGHEAKESLAGGVLYYTKDPDGAGGLWTVPLEGGAETRVAGIPDLFRRNWDICLGGIVFIKQHDDTVQFFDFQIRKAVPVFTPEKALPLFTRDLAISPDGRWILWSQVDVDTKDIGVLDHFQ
jgi:Tol biopolymer transport system component/tRNA A-37 threonylcarbamoyl transferase component Bud32